MQSVSISSTRNNSHSAASNSPLIPCTRMMNATGMPIPRGCSHYSFFSYLPLSEEIGPRWESVNSNPTFSHFCKGHSIARSLTGSHATGIENGLDCVKRKDVRKAVFLLTVLNSGSKSHVPTRHYVNALNGYTNIISLWWYSFRANVKPALIALINGRHVRDRGSFRSFTAIELRTHRNLII